MNVVQRAFDAMTDAVDAMSLSFDDGEWDDGEIQTADNIQFGRIPISDTPYEQSEFTSEVEKTINDGSGNSTVNHNIFNFYIDGAQNPTLISEKVVREIELTLRTV